MVEWEDIDNEFGVRGILDNELGADGLTGPDIEEYGDMMVEDFSGFGNLYKYELTHKNKLMATKYAIPVVGKKGDFKAWKGDSIENVIKQYENGIAKGGDAETTFQDITQADKHLKEKHGFLGTEIWHVTKLVDMGPVSKTAPPAQTTDKSIQKSAAPKQIESAQKAIDTGKTEQQIMAVEQAISPTEMGKTVLYITVGLLVIGVVGGVAYVAYKLSPGGQAAGVMDRFKKG